MDTEFKIMGMATIMKETEKIIRNQDTANIFGVPNNFLIYNMKGIGKMINFLVKDSYCTKMVIVIKEGGKMVNIMAMA